MWSRWIGEQSGRPFLRKGVWTEEPYTVCTASYCPAVRHTPVGTDSSGAPLSPPLRRSTPYSTAGGAHPGLASGHIVPLVESSHTYGLPCWAVLSHTLAFPAPSLNGKPVPGSEAPAHQLISLDCEGVNLGQDSSYLELW